MFLGSSWQRYFVHFLRNIMDTFHKKNSSQAKTKLKEIFRTSYINKYYDLKGFTKEIETLDAGFEDAMQFHFQKAELDTHLRTTNMLERVNREIRRREKVIQIFPNDQSAIRIIFVLMKIDGEWSRSKYLNHLKVIKSL
ncbi:hypothetical protein FZC76_18030 [Sutcliffiella horikoshii]|uniref:Mutator family transposase n=1 Tax=Sutcliffiella horikoshii TaxID=79883 RepID=A0A5D4SR43_9BACI|nr:hypothetical protein FZC76_18030 [Sutcliffiella horikoshii]